MNSLNAGAELDGEVDQSKEDKLANLVLADTPPGDEVELESSVTVIAALESHYENLGTFSDRLKINGCIDQTAALEAHNLTGNFFSGSVGIRNFTEFPTRTGLNTALEALDGEKKNILVRMWEKIKEFAERVLAWIGGVIFQSPKKGDIENAEKFFDKNFKRHQSVANGFVVVRERGDIFDRLGDILRRKGVEQAVLDNVEMVGHKISEYFEAQDKRFVNFRDAVANNPVMTAVIQNNDLGKELASTFEDVVSFRKEIDELKSAIEKSKFSTDDFNKSSSEVQEDVDKMDKEFNSITERLKVITAKQEQIYNSEAGKRFSSDAKNYELLDLLDDAAYLNKKINATLSEALQDMSSEYQNLEKSLTTLLVQLTDVVKSYEDYKQTNGNQKQDAASAYQAVWRKCFNIVTNYTRILSRIVTDAKRASSSSTTFIAFAIEFVEAITKYVNASVKTLPESVREQVQEYLEGLGFDFSGEYATVEQQPEA